MRQPAVRFINGRNGPSLHSPLLLCNCCVQLGACAYWDFIPRNSAVSPLGRLEPLQLLACLSQYPLWHTLPYLPTYFREDIAMPCRRYMLA